MDAEGTVRIAVFDMDGTLADNVDLAIAAAHDGLREYFARRGGPERFPEAEEVRALMGLPADEYFTRLLPPDRREDGRELAWYVERHEVRRLARGEGQAFPGAETVVQELRAANWKLALVSNCLRPYFEANLANVVERSWFDVALCLSDGPSKRELVGVVLRALGGAGPRGAMIGDRAGDIEAGRANGLVTIGCRYGYGAPGELDGADAQIASLDELPAALERLVPGSG